MLLCRQPQAVDEDVGIRGQARHGTYRPSSLYTSYIAHFETRPLSVEFIKVREAKHRIVELEELFMLLCLIQPQLQTSTRDQASCESYSTTSRQPCGSLEVVFFSPAKITPSSARTPTVEPAKLMASIAYST